MTISPDQIIVLDVGVWALNATVMVTWLIMVVLTLGAWLITRRISDATEISRWQNLLEVLVSGLRDQIEAVSRQRSGRYLPFVGTLFIFILVSNLLHLIPGLIPPTGSLSTTVALALCVFVAVPVFGIAHEGVVGYLRQYMRPTPLMLPFNIISELSRTVALAVRLYGNIMSGTVIAGILLSLAPFVFPVLMQLLGLITGVIQAYIFAILAMVYIASASSVRRSRTPTSESEENANG